MILIMLPFFLFAMYEQHGQPLEVVLRHIIETRFQRPRIRVYETDNFYAAIDRDVRMKKEVNLILQSGQIHRDSVTNEIDVMAVQGIQPVFISCKTCEVHTDALNELAILRDRFGGKFARAILVTSEMTGKTREPVRRRADNKLSIELVEWEDVSLESRTNRLRNQDG